MVVPVKSARVAFAGAHVFERGTIYKIDVHPAIVVVVKNSNAAAHGIHDVAFVEAATREMEIDSGNASDVSERCWSGGGKGDFRLCSLAERKQSARKKPRYD